LVRDSDNHPLLVSVRGDQIAVLIIDVHLLVRPARRLFVLAVFAPDRWLPFLPDAAPVGIVYVKQAVFSERVERPLCRRLRTLVPPMRYVTATILVHNRITILYPLRPVRLSRHYD